MAFYSGFFNSKGLDRTYTAEDFTSYLSSIICNGILDTYGQMFKLTAASSGLKVNLGTGKAWINGHYFINDARYSIDLSSYQDESLPRYVGTEEEWLTSLHGADGKDGKDGETPDMSEYPKTSEVTQIVDREIEQVVEDFHTHPNKETLDAITPELFGELVGLQQFEDETKYEIHTLNEALDNFSRTAHTHENKDTLDALTPGLLALLQGLQQYKTAYKLKDDIASDQLVDEHTALRTIAMWESLHPTNVMQKTQFIIEHFMKNVSKMLGGQAKAMIVAASRPAVGGAIWTGVKAFTKKD